MSIAHNLSLAISDRLAVIRTANGYATDIGERVHRGKKKLDEAGVPCVVIFEEEPVVGDENRRAVKVAQSYFIEGHAACNPEQPNDVGHAIVADIRRAIFSHADPTFGEVVRSLKYVTRHIGEREDGLAIVSAYVKVTVEYVEPLFEA